jgi:hypothetical protein
MCGNNPYRVQTIVVVQFPGFSLRSNPGLKLVNAFGVIIPIFKLTRFARVVAHAPTLGIRSIKRAINPERVRHVR